MTHDELIEEITAYERRTCNLIQDNSTCVSLHPLANALRAVVELHKPYVPMDNETGDYSVLAYCNCSKAFNQQDVVLYPCPTIQAIEKELGE